jgi:hypothetical protein
MTDREKYDALAAKLAADWDAAIKAAKAAEEEMAKIAAKMEAE